MIKATHGMQQLNQRYIQTLNSTYLNSIENIWSSKITTHNYEVGGMRS